MRIIAGRLKGKSLMFLKSLNTRPLKDSVKENIFNIVSHSKLINVILNNSKILDLYSGVGSFGLEALSRGAKKVTFIEKDKNAVKVLKKNISNLAVENDTELFCDEANNVLESRKIDKFDILFLDPPFVDKNFIEIIKLIKNKQIYKKKNLVVIHRDRKTKDDLKNILNVFLTKTYSRSKILFANFLTQ
jgi:16S rRNA (guanine966-N2)-methyltransferase